jgi:hypothetical protein
VREGLRSGNVYQAVRRLSVLAYRRSARWPIGLARIGEYLGAMTTYTTPHFATGPSDRNVRTESLNRARPASAATYRTAGVSNEAAALADGPTPDWQPGASKGIPKAAIGALGAALVGGVALAIVLMAPSADKVTKQVMPDPIAQAAAQNTVAQKSVDATDAAVNAMEKQPPAAGNVAATDAAAAAAANPPAVVPAPVQSVTPDAAPVATAPVARLPRHTATQRVAPQPVQTAPVVTPDVPAPTVTPPADVQAPAMQQTPDTPTVTPSAPTPVPATPDTPAPAPAQ